MNLLTTISQMHDVRIWAYCLMDNHVHVIAVPKNKEGLVQCFQELHRAYTRAINAREGWKGFLWQGRFYSFPMEERHLIAAIRYVERNPVEAGMVRCAEEYAWSSARAHVLKTADPLLSSCFLVDQIRDWAAFLKENDAAFEKSFEAVACSGRPFGSEGFIQQIERKVGRNLLRRKPGPKARVQQSQQDNQAQPQLDLSS